MNRSLEDIETPALIIDAAQVRTNIGAFQAHCTKAGLRLRPHIKTHKSGLFARQQLAAGAIGITCQKISEAEVMAAAGVDDILITFNIVGAPKVARLRALAKTVPTLAVVADNLAVVKGLSDGFAPAPRPLSVLVECDTGAGRCGVQTPQAAAALAKAIAAAPGLHFGGLMTYPPTGGQHATARFLTEAKAALTAGGLACPVVSSGGSPDMWSAQTHDIITEYRIGTYIFNDRSLVEQGTCGWEDCAAYVLATVVSTPSDRRVIIDAGSKALSSDLLGLSGHGHVLGHPSAQISALSEEHGTVDFPGLAPLKVGARIRIIPNHICVVTNLFNSAWLQEKTCTPVAIDARGLLT